MKKRTRNNGGYSTLMGVLILGAIGTSIAISLMRLGLDAGVGSADVQEGIRARAFAWACAEEGLMRIRASSTFQGSASLSLAGGQCTYEVILGAGETREVRSTASSSNFFARLTVSVSAINPAIVVSSYRDVSGF